MHALHSTLLPSSAIHHSLFLPNFTPSTIYPLPVPNVSAPPDIRVTGNLIVAGGSDLRVFEIREEKLPLLALNGDDEPMDKEEGELGAVEEDFFDNGPSDRAPLRFQTTRKLHLLTRHQVHGTITGLAALRTVESSIDGLDRLLVSFKEAKMALLEWSRGDISTVSLHTYERCPQMITGDLQNYIPLLRSDPLSRIALLTLPEDSLAVLPLLQEHTELDPMQESLRDAPYSPSFILSLYDVSPTIKNIQDLQFLPGFHSPTLALLYTPEFTWPGRYKSSRDTYNLEIRTFDLSHNGSYPLLLSVPNLPSDSLYVIPCPSELGGVVLVTSTGLIHIDQSGRTVATSVNGWWSYTTDLKSETSHQQRKLSLEGSKGIFVTERDMLLILHNGDVHQVRFEMDGRSVGSLKVDEQSSSVPPPSCVVGAGSGAIFVGCEEGDSILARIDAVREEILEEIKVVEEKVDMEVDYDEDLYGDIPDETTNGHGTTTQTVATGPARIEISRYDTLTGVGKILDMEFGIATSDAGARTYPQLVTIGGGSKRSTLNVFRRGIPITKRRRFNELSNSDAVWFLPIQRAGGHKLKNIPEPDRMTMLFSSEIGQTRIFALSTKATPEQIGRIGSITVSAGAFFQRTCVIHVSPAEVTLLDSDGKLISTVNNTEDASPITSASISDPYVVIRRADGSVTFFTGDTPSRSVRETRITQNTVLICQAVEVFTDTSGVYRTFEAASKTAEEDIYGESVSKSPTITKTNGHSNTTRAQLTMDQIKRLQEEKPEIVTEEPRPENVLTAGHGTQWLALLTQQGEFQIRSLPSLEIVFRSEGLGQSDSSFTDDLFTETLQHPADDETDQVKQLLFCSIGSHHPRPHVLALHNSGRLNIYEAQPRFTLDNKAKTSTSRRSLAIRFRKIHTQLLPLDSSSKLQYTLIPFTNIEGLTGAFVTGAKPFWIVGSDAHGVRAFGLKQAAMAFGRTTHLGGTGDYFIRIEDGSFICYLPPSLNTEFTIPCDRYEMERVYTNLAFDPYSGHYVGATAITVPFQAYDEEGEIQLGPEGETLIPPTNERSSLELFSQGSDPWRVIDGYDFDQNEQVLCMTSANLESPSVPSGYRDFIAVGTGFDFAEDRACRGNLYIFEVVETVSAPGKLGGWRLKMRTKDPARNPVSAVAAINGYLLNSNGPKVYVKGLDDDERLMGLAFLDVQIYVTSIKVFKNLILISDFLKSVWLVSFQEDPYKFTAISKDLQPVALVQGDFLVHDGQVTFITNDRVGEMRMVDFAPRDPESLNGEKLLTRTEYHTGTITMTSKAIARRRTAEEEFAPQTQIIYGNADGSLTTIVSVKPARFKRLQLVSDQLVRAAQHVAGLNPRAYRTVRNDLLVKPLSKGILDGALLDHFALQPISRQREMLRQIGTDAVTVASDLQGLGGFW